VEVGDGEALSLCASAAALDAASRASDDTDRRNVRRRRGNGRKNMTKFLTLKLGCDTGTRREQANRASPRP
jgi:hypothetical protein